MTNENTAIQPLNNDERRLALLAEYKASEHLIEWTAFDKRTNRSTVVKYLPAAWRLYELGLRYPTANFDIDIIHMDVERNFCIVRARLYFGLSYEASEKRAVAHKQGPLSELDKVETKAKARAARDFGIGTEYALDLDDSPANEVQGTIVASSLTTTAEPTIVEQSNEEPKQLPQPDNVQPMKPKPQPRKAPPAKQPAPQAGKLVPGQYNALKTLYLRLNQEIPPDLGEWSFEQAAATIQGLQGQLKQAS